MASRRHEKRKMRRRACQGKIRHETQHDAERHIASLRRKDSDKMRVYRCETCAGWHVGHAPRVWGAAT